MNLIVATSTVADDNMYNRHDPLDQAVIHNREVYLQKNHITMDQAIRLRVAYDREDFCRYVEVNGTNKGQGMQGEDIDVADALITTEKYTALFLPIADCVGTVLYDPTTGVLALAHLGRHSLEQLGGEKIVAYLTEKHGVDPKNLKLWLTPAPNKDLYPIWALASQGMKEVAFEQLKKAGVLIENITDNPADSATDPNYYSYTAFYNGLRPDDGDYCIVAMMTD
jgi:copper oxidase (laccase) domain-containing protein